MFLENLSIAPFHDRNSGPHIVGTNLTEDGEQFEGFMYTLVIYSTGSFTSIIATEVGAAPVDGSN